MEGKFFRTECGSTGDGMTDQQIQGFRRHLEKQLTESMIMFGLVSRSLTQTLRACSDEPAVESFNEDIEQLLELADKERNMVGKIHQAMNRIDLGKYGICISCKRQICMRHLEVFPTAIFCSECRQFLEQNRDN